MEFASDAVVEAIKAAEADTPAAADRASQILAHCAHNMHEYTVRLNVSRCLPYLRAMRLTAKSGCAPHSVS